MIPINLIDKVIHDFYQLAQTDILIGYHFRVIPDFDEHIPRIVQFWNLQLNGKIEDKSHLPFKYLEKHKALKPNKGEIFRWVKLFNSVLDKHEDEFSKEQKELWVAKVDLFSKKLDEHLFGL